MAKEHLKFFFMSTVYSMASMELELSMSEPGRKPFKAMILAF